MISSHRTCITKNENSIFLSQPIYFFTLWKLRCMDLHFGSMPPLEDLQCILPSNTYNFPWWVQLTKYHEFCAIKSRKWDLMKKLCFPLHLENLQLTGSRCLLYGICLPQFKCSLVYFTLSFLNISHKPPDFCLKIMVKLCSFRPCCTCMIPWRWTKVRR